MNPTAWILRVACNRALDHARHDQLGRQRQPEFAALVDECLSATAAPSPRFEDEIRDSQLRMMFVCCHPGLPTDAQVALTLKVLGGFGEMLLGGLRICPILIHHRVVRIVVAQRRTLLFCFVELLNCLVQRAVHLPDGVLVLLLANALRVSIDDQRLLG